MDDSVSSTKVSINLSSSETIRNLYFLKERKIFVLTADVENRGYLDTLKEIAEQKKDCGVKVFHVKIGIGTLLVSIGILVMPIINLISHSELGYYIGLILIVVGVFYIIFIIVKYNGKLISFKK